MDRGMSEFDLIERLKRLSKPGGPVTTGIGDDASVTVHDGPTATSVDAIVEGVHFSRRWSTARQIAQKAIGSALSDLAGMAADPGEVYVTLGMPADTPPHFREDLVDGFAETAEAFGTTLAGGDTVASPVMFVSVTAVGRAPAGEELILRSGATPGDLVAVTGEFGGAGAGLLLLDGADLSKEHRPALELADDLRGALVLRQIEPQPRLSAGRALRESGVSALIDVSDGLAADLGHVARASGVAVEIAIERVPVQAGVAEVADAFGRRPEELALAAGEDYELAFTLPGTALATVEERLSGLGCGFTLIGEVLPGQGVEVSYDGRPEQPPGGFDHFS
jgi:thiamine-monophosphate kinase